MIPRVIRGIRRFPISTIVLVTPYSSVESTRVYNGIEYQRIGNQLFILIQSKTSIPSVICRKNKRQRKYISVIQLQRQEKPVEIPGVFFLPLSLRHRNTPGQPVLRKRLLSTSIHPQRFLACSAILCFHSRPFYRKTNRSSPFSILYKIHVPATHCCLLYLFFIPLSKYYNIIILSDFIIFNSLF